MTKMKDLVRIKMHSLELVYHFSNKKNLLVASSEFNSVWEGWVSKFQGGSLGSKNLNELLQGSYAGGKSQPQVSAGLLWHLRKT